MTIVVDQDPEAVRTRVVWLVALATVALCAVLVAIAWWLVEPPGASPSPRAPSPLETSLFDTAHGADDIRASDDARIHRYDWVDRTTRLVHIPIDRAIDAVVADPSLVRHRPPGVAQVPR